MRKPVLNLFKKCADVPFLRVSSRRYKQFAGNRDRKEVVRMKRIILVLTAALLLAAMMVAAAPAFAQEEKKEEEKKDEKKKDEKKDEKKEEKDLPKSGGIPIDPSLLGIGAGALLVGGGLVAVRVARRH